eukprot:TRINITY_DN179_c0_g4_i1.p1 TRINITY_DN179_c0_g4~~TRINITY_DN179_c0_g4_i1.p1  ORF type:complete len:1596 (-),score=468.58 TRINITY_DN179_c0_g4_i1:245-5032(-)
MASRTPKLDLKKVKEARKAKSSSRRSLRSSRKSSDEDALLEMARPQEGRVVLNGQSLKSMDGFRSLHRAEFLYLRDNFFDSFESFDSLLSLKILDLSQNRLATFDFLRPLPMLKELYLNGNMFASLEGFPLFPELEVLSLSYNELTSLSGMCVHPELRVLSISGNKLASLDGFTRHPQLEVVFARENPFCSKMEYRTALVACCSSTLRKVDGDDVSSQDLDRASLVSAKGTMCLQAGMVLPESGNVEAMEDEFLLSVQKENLKGKDIELVHIGTYGDAIEGKKIQLCVILAAKNADIRSSFFPGELVSKAFVYEDVSVPAVNVRFKCPDGKEAIVPMTKEPDGYKCNLFFTKGTFKYWFEDGQKTVSSEFVVEITEELIQERKSAVLHLDDGSVEQYGSFTIQWFRSNPDRDFLENPRFVSCFYDLNLNDVDCCIMAEVSASHPIIGSQACVVFAVSPIVRDAEPTIKDLVISGSPVEGDLLGAEYTYFGGVEGQSIMVWTQDGSDEVLCDKLTYVPHLSDVGKRLLLKVTPCSDRNVKGESVTALTSVVRPGKPSIRDVSIEGDGMELKTLRITGEYFGGLEGESKIQWFQKRPEDEEFTPIEGANEREYCVGYGDIHNLLKVEYTPVSVGGSRGDPVTAEISSPVRAARPQLLSFRLEGVPMEGKTLRIVKEYAGGDEAKSIILWYSKRPEESIFRHIEANDGKMEYKLAYDDIGRIFRVEYVPKRSDNLTGDLNAVETSGPVVSCPPYISTAFFEPAVPVQGRDVVVKYQYRGGDAGEISCVWSCETGEGSEEFEEMSDQEPFVCVPSMAELGRKLRVVVTPMNRAGDIGDPYVLTTESAVVPAPPQIMDVSYSEGSFVEGEEVRVLYTYWGGVEGTTIFKWKRAESKDGENAVVIQMSDEETLGKATYVPTTADVGKYLFVEITPVRIDGIQGESVLSPATDAPVAPASPKIMSLKFTGELHEGDPVPYECVYFGGVEGESVFVWSRLDEDDEDGEDVVVSNTNVFVPTKDDVGCKLKVVVTPRRNDGAVGPEVSCVSDTLVIQGFPKLIDPVLKTAGQGGKAVLIPNYVGGKEGESSICWFRQSQETGHRVHLVYLDGKLEKDVTLEDVNRKLVVEYVPQRDDGEVGEMVVIESEPIPPARPQCSSVEIIGEIKEGVTLKAAYKYVGGYEGKSKIRWYRVTEGEDRVLLSTDDCYEYTVMNLDAGCKLGLECIPFREDGVRGEAAYVESGVVEPLPPKIVSLELEGGPYFTKPVELYAKYQGGHEGESIIKWLRKRTQDADFTEVKVAGGLVYVPNADDLSAQVKVQYTPVRKDGVQGTMVEAGPVTLHMDPEFNLSLSAVVRDGKISIGVHNEDDKNDELLYMGNKNVKLGLVDKVLYKENYSASMNVSCVNEKVAELQLSKKTFRFSFNSQKDRDYMVLVCRLFLGMGVKSYAREVLGKQVSKDWASKSTTRRSSVFTSLQRDGVQGSERGEQLPAVSMAKAIMKSLTLTRGQESMLAKARIERDQRKARRDAEKKVNLVGASDEVKSAWLAGIVKYDARKLFAEWEEVDGIPEVEEQEEPKKEEPKTPPPHEEKGKEEVEEVGAGIQ